MAVSTALEENHIDHEPKLCELTQSLSRRHVVKGTLVVWAWNFVLIMQTTCFFSPIHQAWLNLPISEIPIQFNSSDKPTKQTTQFERQKRQQYGGGHSVKTRLDLSSADLHPREYIVCTQIRRSWYEK